VGKILAEAWLRNLYEKTTGAKPKDRNCAHVGGAVQLAVEAFAIGERPCARWNTTTGLLRNCAGIRYCDSCRAPDGTQQQGCCFRASGLEIDDGLSGGGALKEWFGYDNSKIVCCA